jgi:predicted AAA+ superfamily ATPase
MTDTIYIKRAITSPLLDILHHKKNVLLLGPRQTGKTTLLQSLIRSVHLSAFKTLSLNLAHPTLRLRYERDPGALIAEVEAVVKTTSTPVLVIVDEIQKVTALLDAVQYLIDQKTAQFILTGSSARQLRRAKTVNFLPGRVLPMYLNPLTYLELNDQGIEIPLEAFLVDGALPEIILEPNLTHREQRLAGYVSIYLEEEVRLEALVRNLGQFSRFLELAAAESGKIVNFSKLSQEIGVAQNTIQGFYQILEDCLMVHKIEALSHSNTRKKLQKTPKYLLYDLGVRRIAAGEGRKPPLAFLGYLFEQYIGLMLLTFISNSTKRLKLKYWRDPGGAEIDWIIEGSGCYIPIEVKYSDLPKIQDTKHLKIFMEEYPAPVGYIICRTPFPMQLTDTINALPWNALHRVLESVG